MANENYIEELKVQIYDSINSQRNSARKKLDSDLEALKVEYEKKKFELQDSFVSENTGLNHYENYIQMGDFFALSDVTNALSQMISNAEGEKYISHKTNVMDEDGNVLKTVVSFVKEDAVDRVDDMIGYKHSLNPESVKEENPNYVYLTEYDERNLGNVKDYFLGNIDVYSTEAMVTFNPDNEYLDGRHVLGRIYDSHFDYVNSFMDSATRDKLLYGFEKPDDLAQMAIIHGVGIYQKNNPKPRRGRIKSIFNKKQ